MTPPPPPRTSSRFFAAFGLFVLTSALIVAPNRAPASDAPTETSKSVPTAKPSASDLFDRDNLVAWCVVPFDSKKRGPEERAEMLRKLGFKHFAYDWRAEHVSTFDAELDALKKNGVQLDAFWVAPGELNDQSRAILDGLKRHGVKTQLWALLDLGPVQVTGDEQAKRVDQAASKLKPLADEAAKIGCTVGLYNHGGWFGEPENQIAVIERLKEQGATNIGIVYNFHHGHPHLDRFQPLLAKMLPHLLALNLNGMDPGADPGDRKILPLGQGELDLELLTIIRDSGYRGRIGVLGHTMDDAEDRLRDNLDGLDWLVAQLDGKDAGPKPTPRTPAAPRVAAAKSNGEAALLNAEQAKIVAALVEEAQRDGDAARGASVFTDLKFSCFTCHKVGEQGGDIGPELTNVGGTLSPEDIAASVLWPKLSIKEGYEAFAVSLDDGRMIQGYKVEETPKKLTLRDAASGKTLSAPTDEIEEMQSIGTLMPEGLAEAMSQQERADLIRFLADLGKPGAAPPPKLAIPTHGHNVDPATFTFSREPLQPEFFRGVEEHVNRGRTYDFYAKEADHFRKMADPPMLLPTYPGLDGGGKKGHWGNQNEKMWEDDRWNHVDLGPVVSGVFRSGELTIPKGVCILLGDQGEMATCFNPETLAYEELWTGGFVHFANRRWGFMEGPSPAGTLLPKPENTPPAKPFAYNGIYRNGKRVLISYSIDGEEWLEAPWVEDGKFVRNAAPADKHPLRDLTRGGAPQWPQVLVTKGTLGQTAPYATDTIAVPFDNPWNALMFFGDHDFLSDGTAMLATMQGEVWRVEGIDETLQNVRWRRYATGLHQALGLVVADDRVYVLGRDQITELIDLNNDGEADFYRCVNNSFITSPAGHDFICGLQHDAQGNFYANSGNQGVLRIPPDGGPVEVVASGIRNPDGLGLTSDGVLTSPNSEGEWVPTSMILEVKPGEHYGYPGPREGETPALPLVYLPRGLDNSSGGQVEVTSDRWGPLKGQLIHFSFGMGTAFLVLRDHVDGQAQGAVVPLPGDFRSGVHRGRFNPRDGQLYASGMRGWSTYTPDDGNFERIRYTGAPAQFPIKYHAVENGVVLTFSQPIDPEIVAKPENRFAQIWNYRYSASYGSREYSIMHPNTAGHDPLKIRSAHVLSDGKTLFLEIPDIQPVNTLHLRLEVDQGQPQELFATVHKLAPPFTDFDGYKPEKKIIAAHPILADMAALHVDRIPNPWAEKIPVTRAIKIGAGQNLTFSTATLKAKAGETIKLTFVNPDVVPHNWVLLRPGSLNRVGELVNEIIADPEAAIRSYIPETDDVLVYVDIVDAGREASIYFKVPDEPGRYPYLCSFPGHWMIMNGVMIVE